MAVQNDAGDLLFFLYDELKNKGKSEVKAQDVFDKTRWESKRINLAYEYLNQKGVFKEVIESRDNNGLNGFIVRSLSPDITTSTTPRPPLGESALENIALHEGRQVVVCYGGKDGLDVAEFLKKQNPYGYINFIIAPTTLQYGKPAPKDGVLDKEIRQSHCVVVLLDKNGFLKSEKAKKEFKIILQYKRDSYIPIFLVDKEKENIIKVVKEEFGINLSEIQYGIFREPFDDFLEKLYADIRKIVISLE
ncbi:MAG: hypothetical protein WA144_15170 [Candidatus Methanoperedens sp.]